MLVFCMLVQSGPGTEDRATLGALELASGLCSRLPHHHPTDCDQGSEDGQADASERDDAVSAASDEAGVGGDDVGGNSQGEQNRAQNQECSIHASSV